MIRIKLPRVRAIDSEQLIIFAYCLLVVISILNTTQFGDIMGYHLIVRGIKYLCMALVFFAFWMRKNISPKTFLMAVILTAVGVGFMKTDADVGYYNAAVKIKTILVSIVTSLLVSWSIIDYLLASSISIKIKSTLQKSSIIDLWNYIDCNSNCIFSVRKANAKVCDTDVSYMDIVSSSPNKEEYLKSIEIYKGELEKIASVYKGILHKTTKNGLPTY